MFFLAENEQPLGAQHDKLDEGIYPVKDNPPKRSQFTTGFWDEENFREDNYAAALQRYKVFRLWEEWLFEKIQAQQVQIYGYFYDSIPILFLPKEEISVDFIPKALKDINFAESTIGVRSPKHEDKHLTEEI